MTITIQPLITSDTQQAIQDQNKRASILLTSNIFACEIKIDDTTNESIIKTLPLVANSYFESISKTVIQEYEYKEKKLLLMKNILFYILLASTIFGSIVYISSYFNPATKSIPS